MIGRRATVGLALLSALVFCAVAAQSSLAAKAVNTTAFTCVLEGGNADFADAHCNEFVGTEKGKYGHVAVTVGETKSLDATNQKVKNNTTENGSITLKSNHLGAAVEVTCETMKTATSKSTVHNVEKEGKHTMTGNGTAEFEKCKVLKPLNCTIKEPLTAAADFEGVEGLGESKNEMGVEFKQQEGKNIAEISFEGASCTFKGKTFPITGSAIGTSTVSQTNKWTGATIEFSPANGMQSLKLSTSAAEVFMTVTPTGSGGGGHPIPITTTT